MKGYFIAGIDTNVGKTIVSSTLALALRCDYWKPIQCGDLEHSDSTNVARLTNYKVTTHPETYRLKTSASPHYAAYIDGYEVSVADFILPETTSQLIIEGAGGLQVPLNDSETIADLIAKFKLPVILVSKHYLGSINHTLLSIAQIERQGLPLAGLIFVGGENQAAEHIIVQHTDIRVIGRLPWIENIDSQTIVKFASEVKTWQI